MSFVNGFKGSCLTIPSACVYAALPAAWIIIYCRDPKSFEKLGLQVSKWAEQPEKLITHFLAHGSEFHLAGTVFGFLSSAGVWLSMQSSSALHVPLLDAVAAVGSSIVGGVVGGVGATLFGLYMERLKFVEEHKWGISAIDSLVSRGFKTLRENRVVVCGGSAVVNAFAGFVFGVHDKYLNLAVTIAVDCVMLAASLQKKTSWGSLLGFGGQAATNTSLVGSCSSSSTNGGGGGFFSFGNSDSSVMGSSGSGSNGNTEFAVGHAAHIGGALLGFALGKVYRELRYQYYLYKLRQAREERRVNRRTRRDSSAGRRGGGPIRVGGSGGSSGYATSGRRLGTWTADTQEQQQQASTRRRSRSAEMGGNPFSGVGSPLAATAGPTSLPPISIPPPIPGPSAFESRSSTMIAGIGSDPTRSPTPNSERTVAHEVNRFGDASASSSNLSASYSDEDREAAASSSSFWRNRNALDDTVSYLNQSSFDAYSGAHEAYASPSDAHEEARRRRRVAMGGDPFLGASQQSPRYR